MQTSFFAWLPLIWAHEARLKDALAQGVSARDLPLEYVAPWIHVGRVR